MYAVAIAIAQLTRAGRIVNLVACIVEHYYTDSNILLLLSGVPKLSKIQGGLQ